MHSLGRDQHAVVEVSASEILVRFGMRWMRFTPDCYSNSEGESLPFALTVNGHARVGGDEDAMDLCAERLASAIITL